MKRSTARKPMKNYITRTTV